MERAGLSFYPLSFFEHGSGGKVKEFELSDGISLEETVIWKCLMDELTKELNFLEPQDRDFILMYFDPSFSVTAYRFIFTLRNYVFYDWEF